MPIPKPRKGEHRKDFVQRCMADNTIKTIHMEEVNYEEYRRYNYSLN
jgi:hypothetical protein